MELKNFLKTISLIHTALLLGLVVFGLFAYFQNGSFIARMNRQDVFIYIVPIVAATGYFLSQFLFRKQLQNIKRDETLPHKLSKFQSASLVSYALLEAPGLLSLTAYLLSGNALYLVIAIAVMAYFFAQRPTADKIRKDLPLTSEEQKQFDTLKK